MSGKTFAAASHTGLTDVANNINHVRLNTEHEFFNSGVMLIDLNAARKLVQADPAHRRCALELRCAELHKVPHPQHRKVQSELGRAKHCYFTLLWKK